MSHSSSAVASHASVPAVKPFEMRRYLQLLQDMRLSESDMQEAKSCLDKMQDWHGQIRVYRSREVIKDYKNSIFDATIQFKRLSGDLNKLTKTRHLALSKRLHDVLETLIQDVHRWAIPTGDIEQHQQNTLRRFAEQAFFKAEDAHKATLESMLQAIKEQFNTVQPKPSCFISYAWPTERYPHERYLQPFLVGLHEHLNRAGIHTYLDIRDNTPDASIPRFADKLLDTSHVLLICTESLKDKHLSATARVVQSELSMITQRHDRDMKTYGETKIFPALLSGAHSMAAPAEYMGYRTVRSWRDKHYLELLRDFIEVVYLGHASVHEPETIKQSRKAYKTLWDNIKKPVLNNQHIQPLLAEQLTLFKNELPSMAAFTHSKPAIKAKDTSGDGGGGGGAKADEAAQAPLPSLPDSLAKPINNLPLNKLEDLYPNHYQKELEDLMLEHDVICINGLGGAGKSTLATQVIKQVAKQEHYKLCYLIEDVKSDEALFSGLLRLYEDINNKKQTDVLSRRLDQQESKEKRQEILLKNISEDLGSEIDDCLGILLLDNCEIKDTIFLRKMITTLLTCHLKCLITSRNQCLLDMTEHVKHLSLNRGWNLGERMIFMTKDLGNEANCSELADYLPYPLGLKIASNTIRYIKRTRLGYHAGTYLLEIKAGKSNAKEIRASRHVGEDTKYRQTQIIEKAIDLVREKEGQRLLQFLAYLSPEPVLIDRMVLPFISKHLNKTDEDSLDAYYAKGLELLQAVSLVDDEKDDRGTTQNLKVHALVQDIARRKLPIVSDAGGAPIEGKTEATEVGNIVDNMITTLKESIEIKEVQLHDKTFVDKCNRCALHVKSFIGLLDPIKKNLAKICFSLGGFYQKVGMLHPAKQMYIKAMRSLLIFYGLDPDTWGPKTIIETDKTNLSINIISNLALVHGQLGNMEEKSRLLKQVLKLEVQCFGEQSLPVAQTFDNLSDVSMFYEHHEERVFYLKKALVIFEAEYGQGDYRTAGTLTNLGDAYLKLGKLGIAKSTLDRALEIKRTKLGENHIKSTNTLSSLAAYHSMTGKLQEALELFIKVFNIQKEVYSEKRHMLTGALNNLGTIYGTMGIFDKQIEYQQQSLEIQQTYYGEDNPGVGMTHLRLGNGYLQKGDLNKALEHGTGAFNILNLRFGPAYDYTKKSKLFLQAVKDKLASQPAKEESTPQSELNPRDGGVETNTAEVAAAVGPVEAEEMQETPDDGVEEEVESKAEMSTELTQNPAHLGLGFRSSIEMPPLPAAAPTASVGQDARSNHTSSLFHHRSADIESGRDEGSTEALVQQASATHDEGSHEDNTIAEAGQGKRCACPCAIL